MAGSSSITHKSYKKGLTRGIGVIAGAPLFMEKKENMKKLLELEGLSFGHLYVVERAPDYIDYTGRTRIRWRCLCDCGRCVDVFQENLISGNSKTCGNCLYENTWEATDDYVIGRTIHGESFLVDKKDWQRVNQYYWYPNAEGYYLTVSNGKAIRLHRFIMGASARMIVDHINHDLSDNRRCNLRCVDRTQNGENKKLRVDSTSGCPGVWYRKDNGKWRVSITVNGKRINLGHYGSFDDAVAARKAAEEKYFGEYSYDNSIAAVPQIAV